MVEVQWWRLFFKPWTCKLAKEQSWMCCSLILHCCKSFCGFSHLVGAARHIEGFVQVQGVLTNPLYLWPKLHHSALAMEWDVKHPNPQNGGLGINASSGTTITVVRYNRSQTKLSVCPELFMYQETDSNLRSRLHRWIVSLYGDHCQQVWDFSSQNFIISAQKVGLNSAYKYCTYSRGIEEDLLAKSGPFSLDLTHMTKYYTYQQHSSDWSKHECLGHTFFLQCQTSQCLDSVL